MAMVLLPLVVFVTPRRSLQIVAPDVSSSLAIVSSDKPLSLFNSVSNFCTFIGSIVCIF